MDTTGRMQYHYTMENNRAFEHIEISGDAGIRARGDSLDDLFRNTAQGMFELVTDTSAVSSDESRNLHLESDSPEDLLINWLNELIYLFETEDFIMKDCDIGISKSRENAAGALITLSAKLLGGKFIHGVNESRLLIKAATYHDFSLNKNDGRWEATVIFDI